MIKEDGLEASKLHRAVEAGRATVAALGLQVDEAALITDSDRITLRLAPCDVFVRVSLSEHLAGVEFEVEVARRLAEVGGPVAELDPRVEPRVYERDDFAVSLWTYYEPVGSEIAPALYADALEQYHAALRQIDLEVPDLTDRVAGALSEVSDRKQTPELSDPDRELLSSTLSDQSTVIGGGKQLLHGEPHPGNLLNTRRGPLFVDLATCCRGPIEFDLAHAPEEVAEHYPEADHDLVRRCRVLMWALISTWRWRRDDQFPDRSYWRVEALNRVRAALA
ncbi:phosphotransferase [Actinomadura sp. ATCC 39365]